MPARVQLSRRKGWRMPAGAVKVDRSSRWGNPFKVDEHLNAAGAVAAFRLWIGLEAGAEMRQRLPELRGRDLACWCRPDQPCHADVLLELANQ